MQSYGNMALFFIGEKLGVVGGIDIFSVLFKCS